jgi:hypothetical protein
MALQKQLISVPFTGGVDQKTNKHLLPLSKFETLENCFYEKAGGLRIRNGVVQVGDNTTGPPAAHDVISTVAAINDELVVMDGQSLWSWSPSDAAWYRIEGAVYSCDVRVKSVFGNMEVESTATGPDPVALGDVAVNGNYACYIGQSNGAAPGGLIYRVVDLVSGTVMEGGIVTDADESGCAKVIASSTDDFWIFYQSAAASANLVMFSITNVGTGTITVGSPTNLATDLGTAGIFDIISDASKSFLGLVYVDTSDDMKIASYSTIGSTTPVTGYPITVTGTYSKVAIGEMGDAGDWVIVYFDVANNGVFYRAYNKADNTLTRAQTLVDASTTTGAEFAQVSITEHADSTAWIVWTEYEDADGLEASGVVRYRRITWDSGTFYAEDSAADLFSGGILVGRPVVHGVFEHAFGPILVPVAVYDAGGTADNLAPHSGTLLLVGLDITLGTLPGATKVVARSFVGRLPSYLKTVPRVVDLGSDRFLMATLRVDVAGLSQVGIEPGSYPGRVVAALVGVEYDLATRQLSMCQANGTLLIAGGSLMAYDGETVFAPGFTKPPSIGDQLMTAGGAGTGSLSAGEYSAAMVFMMRDAKGNEYYSGVSTDPTQDTVTVVNTGSLLLDPLPPGYPDSHFYQVLLLFRTAANGSIRYLDYVYPASGSWGSHSLTQADADITSNAVLYTDGGEVDHVLPPTPYCIASSGDVVLLIPGEDRLSIWQSLPVRKNLGAAFSDQLVFNMPSGGDLTAVTFMDGRPIWFRAGEVGFLVGAPPAASGAGGYAEARTIDPSVGAEDFRSIVQIPAGILFKSEKGIHLLGHDMSVSYVGAPVEDYNSQTVLSSMLHAKLNQAWFAMSLGDILVYDYEKNAWSIFTSNAWNWVESLCTYGGVPILGLSSGAVGEMPEDEWLDGGTAAVTATARTGWASLSGLAGFQRLYRIALLGEQAEDIDTGSTAVVSTFSLRMHTNYDEVNQTSLMGNTDTDDISTAIGPIEVRAHVPSQKCSAVAFWLTWEAADTFPTTNNKQAVTWTGITIEIGQKRGLRKLPPAGSF